MRWAPRAVDVDGIRTGGFNGACGGFYAGSPQAKAKHAKPGEERQSFCAISILK